MDGSVDKNTELRSALLYFVDEAIGFRKSVHHFHRWLETGEQGELEQLIIEVGREHFFDLWPIIASIKDPSDNSGFVKIKEITDVHGIHFNHNIVNKSGFSKIDPLPNISNTADNIELDMWIRHDWLAKNNTIASSPYYIYASAYKLISTARDDFYKVFVLLEMLLGPNTLLSCVINNDIQLLGSALGRYYLTEAGSITQLASAVNDNPTLNWKDALSRNQVKSKLWLIEQLDEHKLLPKHRRFTDVNPTVLLVGGWVGMIPFLANMQGKQLDDIINVDIDKSVHRAATTLNANVSFKFTNLADDVRTIDLTKFKKLVVIDTIVEHFENHGDWVSTLPKGTVVILQGNDMFDVPDHVNCHKSLEEFLSQCGLNTILWSGELNLYKCTRYMAIGKV